MTTDAEDALEKVGIAAEAEEEGFEEALDEGEEVEEAEEEEEDVE